MRKKTIFIIVSALSALAVAGCAQKGAVNLTSIEYLTPKGLTEAAPRVVGLSPLKDSRNKPESLVGMSGTYDQVVENEVVLPGTVSTLVTSKIKEALKQRNIAVKDVAWDLTAEGVKTNDVSLQIGGEITGFWVDSKYRALKAETKSSVQMKIYFVDPSEKVLRTIDINSTYEDSAVAFSVGALEDALSEALSTGINQIFDDEKLKKKLQ